jgi:hypothetical protein
MAKKRFSPEQVVAKLLQIEVFTAGGGGTASAELFQYAASINI